MGDSIEYEEDFYSGFFFFRTSIQLLDYLESKLTKFSK